MKKQRRSDVTTEIVVGAFMFVVLLALVTFTIVISQNKLFEKHYDLFVRFENVGGLREGEPVFMRGVKIGNVENIDVATGDQSVQIQLRLTREPDLRSDYRFEIKAASMLGGMLLNIYEGSLTEPPVNNAVELVGTPVTDVLEEAAQTIAILRESLTNGGVLDNIETMTKNLAMMSQELNTGTGTVARLIHDDSVYEEAENLLVSLNNSSEDFQKIARDLQVVSSRLADGKGVIGKLLSEDESLYNDLAGTLESANKVAGDLAKIMERVENGEGTIGNLLSSDSQVYEDLAATMEALRGLSEKLNNENGTIAQLFQNDELYNKVVGLVDEAKATIDDLRETSPITTFSSIFFGAF